MTVKGLVIVISAPSGAGKSTLCGKITANNPNIRQSISCTTRAPRPGEKNGRDYFFVNEKVFKGLIRSGKLLEWAKVHDNYYGTPEKHINGVISSGKDIILNIDVQGGLSVKKHYRNAVLIFVMTPTLKELENRLKKRAKDPAAVIEKRLANARKELAYLNRYDYLVINDKIPVAVNEISSIISVEHRKVVNLNKIKFM